MSRNETIMIQGQNQYMSGADGVWDLGFTGNPNMGHITRALSEVFTVSFVIARIIKCHSFG